MARYQNLFEPLRIGGIIVPNRVCRTAHSTGVVGESLIAYHEARARGGVGLSTLEATGVHTSAPSSIPLYSDACIPFYEELSRRIAPYGMKIFQQLWHAGAGYPEPAGITERWSASAIPNVMAGIVPIAMTRAMIAEVIESFARAARRCRDGGLHGVDIHASSGYLIHEFLSPALNQRTDEYGGSFDNRLRLLREVIAAVRVEVGDGEFAVGVRLPNEDYVPGGLTATDNAAIARAVDPLVDYISLHMGSYWRFHKLIAPADDPLGVEMPANRIVVQGLTKPRIVVGRIMTLDHASAIIASGEADLVSMVRALIADPELVNKARRGDERKIRPCIGTNIGCVGQLMSKGIMGCVVNIAAGREDRVAFDPPEQAATRKKVLVVGGGPAGLEAARTLALRGHTVLLHEATGRLGGQLSLAARAPHRADVGTIGAYLASELDELGVSVQLHSLVDLETVRSIAPDEIVIATGVAPRTDGFQVATPNLAIPGHDLPHVYHAWDLLGLGRKPELVGPVVLFDDTGTFDAISAADVLVKAGLAVTLVSRLEQMGQSVAFPPVTVSAARERLMSESFDFIGGHYLRAIRPGDVEIGVLFTDRVRRLAAQTVVLSPHHVPNRELPEALEAAGIHYHAIGEVHGRNGIMNAIHDAAAVARVM